MKQLESRKLPKHQVHWGSIVHRVYEVSSQTEFAAGRINVIG
jgi:hypothetical protein